MPNYTINDLNSAAWLVYINGIEIPVPRVEIHFGVWTMPTATLQMVPHPSLQRIGAEDRLQVAIFYLDIFWDPDNPQFRLFHEFEVIGWSYTNTSSGRFIQLDCVSHLQILEQLKFYYMASLNNITEGALPTIEDTSVTVATVVYPASLFLKGITMTGGADNKFIQRPIEFVLNIFSAILREFSVKLEDARSVPIGMPGDSKPILPQAAVSVPNKNFFKPWLNKTKFHRKWVALPGMEDVTTGTESCFPILKAAQDTLTMEALRDQVGVADVGDSGSAWDLLKKVYGYMYMEVATIPAPPLVPIDKTSQVIGVTLTPWLAIASHVVKPQCIFAIPPMCNVFFPCMIQNYMMQENYMSQPTRLYLGESFISSMLSNSSASAGMSMITRELLTTGFPAPVQSRLKQSVSEPGANDKNMLLFPEEFFKGPVESRLSAPPWLYLLAQKYRANNAGLESVAGLGNVFDLYAEYEFFRSRFAAKSGGLSLAFNPYVTPGFPAMIFDSRSGGFDTMGYVNDVTHVMSAGGSSPPSLSTQVGLTFMRLPMEFINIHEPEAFPASAESAELRKWRFQAEADRKGFQAGFRGAIDKLLAAVASAEAGTSDDSWWQKAKNFMTSVQHGSPYWQGIPSDVTGLSDEQVREIAGMLEKSAGDIVPADEVQRALLFRQSWFAAQKKVDELSAAEGVPAAAAQKALLDIAPPEVTPDVQNAFQKIASAEKIYNRLLRRGSNVKRPAAFDWQKWLDIVDAFTGKTVTLHADTSTFDRTLVLKPKAEVRPLFDNYNAAMQYAARPACTLIEYIELWHETSTGVHTPIETLIERGRVTGEDRSFYGVGPKAESNAKGKKPAPTTPKVPRSAIFWGRIYTLIPGPGKQPVPEFTNIVNGVGYKPASVRYVGQQEGGWLPVTEGKDIAQTRKDWDSILVAYRNIIRAAGGKLGVQLQL